MKEFFFLRDLKKKTKFSWRDVKLSGLNFFRAFRIAKCLTAERKEKKRIRNNVYDSLTLLYHHDHHHRRRRCKNVVKGKETLKIQMMLLILFLSFLCFFLLTLMLMLLRMLCCPIVVQMMPKRQTTEEWACEEANTRKNKENLTKSTAINRESDGHLMSSRKLVVVLA